MGFGWIAGILLLAAIVWGLTTAQRGGAPPDSPQQILKRRYAGGEISGEEYERKLSELRK